MPQENILDRVGKLHLGLKLAGFGSFLTIVSVFLPWYSDIDIFNTGEKYIGLSGPLYLLGFLVLTLSLFAFFLVGMRFMEKKLPKLPMKEAHCHIFSGAMSLFLLVIASSIYFHQRFGVNITMKEMRFGMIMAFFGVFAILLGGIQLNKGEKVSFDVEGKLDSLIDVEASKVSSVRIQRDINQNESRDERTPISVKVETSHSDTEKQNLF